MTIFSFDYYIAKVMNDFLNSSNHAFTPVLKFITSLGDAGIAFILSSLIMLLFVKTRKAGICAIISLILGVVITNLLLKNTVCRPRPFIDTTSVFYTWWQEAGSLKASSYSFPSGHTTGAMAFAFPFVIYFNKKYSWLFLVIPFLMGFTRIYFMVHYASDVLAGLMVGTFTSIVSYYLVNCLLHIKWIRKAFDLPSVISLFK